MPPSSLSTLGRDRAAFLAAYDAFTPDQRAFRPADGGWTADEVAEHLVRVDSGILAALAKQMAAGTARRTLGRPSLIRPALVTRFMRSGGQTRMPPAVAPHITPVGTDGAASRVALGESAEAWTRLGASVAPDLARTALWMHPVGGPYTFAQAAGFHASHFDHHTRQLARIRVSDGFPA